jgi:hypothetical protein
MTPRHLDDLFSAAYEDELSPAEQTRFESHMEACEPCAAAYDEFKAGIAALKELPQARMPHAVHLPSTLPVAERPSRPTIGLSWFNLGLLRRFPATAVAGAVAVVLVIVAIRVGDHSTLGGASLPTNGSAIGATAPHAAPGAATTTTSCTQPTPITGSTPPISFAEETQAADPQEPALHLVIAAPTQVVSAGSTVLLYAQLSVPSTSIANPSSVVPTPPAKALLPCVSVGVATSNEQLTVFPPGSEGLSIPEATSGTATGANGYQPAEAGSEYAFTVPAGLATGTQIHVIATVPAGFAAFGSPALTAELTLTIG